MVPYAVYRKVHPRHQLKFGVVEVLAQQITLASTHSESGWVRHKVYCPPMALSHANSSCIHAACERMAEFRVERIWELCDRSGAVFINDGPDGHSANQRKKLQVANQIKDKANAFFNLEGCAVHQLHRAMATSLPETDIIGDVHTFAFSCAQVQHQNKLQRVLWDLISEMEVVASPPDPTTLAHHRLVVSQTLCRRIDVTSGRLIDGEVVFSSPAHVEKRSCVEKLLAFLNGLEVGSSHPSLCARHVLLQERG